MGLRVRMHYQMYRHVTGEQSCVFVFDVHVSCRQPQPRSRGRTFVPPTPRPPGYDDHLCIRACRPTNNACDDDDDAAAAEVNDDDDYDADVRCA